MVGLLYVLTVIVVVTFLLINTIYLTSALFAGRELRDIGRGLKHRAEQEAYASPLTPGVTILVPARNEQMAIVDTVQSLLSLRYPRFEVIVLDSASTDRTRERLIAEFDLVPAARASRAAIPTGPIGPIFVSTRHPELWLVCKLEPGKADALNTGVNIARYPFVASVDGDALLEEDALLGLIQPVLADPEEIIGAGGLVRAVNGSLVRHGRVMEVRVPPRIVAAIQVEEYLRSMLLMRTSLSRVSSLMVISGTFGLFRRDRVERAGGYFTRTAADDVEIVIHLYRDARDHGQLSRIVFLPEPVCWTEVPDTLRELLRQRRRWHRGIAEAIWRHRQVLFRPRYGRLGFIAMPYLLLELIGPPIELLSWLIVGLAAVVGVLSVPLLLVFLGVSFMLNVVLSLAALTAGEVDYRRQAAPGGVGRMVGHSLLGIIVYRPLVSAACLCGLWDFVRGRRPYVQPTRRGHERG